MRRQSNVSCQLTPWIRRTLARTLLRPWRRGPSFILNASCSDRFEKVRRSAMLGYAIGRNWWGQGIATEAARALITWGIKELDLARLWASTDVRNVRSQRVLEKLGMRRESVRLADRVGRNGEYPQEVLYTLDVR
ncbi:MAG TPA: GNAT family N-acetyltransferase [Polyangiaceae bacterium]|nr:GNAT family N-acetyltransferase [Polyangiaceae bacterium]